MCRIYYVTGITCVGKDTMMERAEQLYPNLVGLVQVGKEFRRRYPPEHFKGKAAMQSTEVEAREIYDMLLQKAIDEGKKFIFVAGQPRLVSQIKFTIDRYPGTVVWMHVKDETIHERLKKRFPGDPASIELSINRIKNDRLQLYDVIFNLVKQGHNDFVTFDGDYEQVDDLIHNLIHFPSSK